MSHLFSRFPVTVGVCATVQGSEHGSLCASIRRGAICVAHYFIYTCMIH